MASVRGGRTRRAARRASRRAARRRRGQARNLRRWRAGGWRRRLRPSAAAAAARPLAAAAAMAALPQGGGGGGGGSGRKQAAARPAWERSTTVGAPVRGHPSALMLRRPSSCSYVCWLASSACASWASSFDASNASSAISQPPAGGDDERGGDGVRTRARAPARRRRSSCRPTPAPCAPSARGRPPLPAGGAAAARRHFRRRCHGRTRPSILRPRAHRRRDNRLACGPCGAARRRAPVQHGEERESLPGGLSTQAGQNSKSLDPPEEFVKLLEQWLTPRPWRPRAP